MASRFLISSCLIEECELGGIRGKETDAAKNKSGDKYAQRTKCFGRLLTSICDLAKKSK